MSTPIVSPVARTDAPEPAAAEETQYGLARAVRALAVLAVVAAAWLIARRVDARALAAAFRDARPGLLLLAGAFGLVQLWWKAVMWRVMLHATPPVPVRRLFAYTVTAFAASTLTPARAGEVLRLWLLRRNHQIPFTRSAGAALAEKVLDALALLVFVGPLPWLVPPLPGWTGKAVLTLAGVGLIALLGGILGARHLRPTSRMAVFLGQIRVLREPAVLVRAFGAALAASAFDFAMLWTSLRAVNVSLGLAGVAFVLLTINAAIAVPSTPGNVGALEVGAVFAVGVLGVPRARAVAFALLYHAVQIGPLLVFALFNLRVLAKHAAPPDPDPGEHVLL